MVDSPATGEDFEVVLRYETASGKPIRNLNVAVQVQTLLGDVMVQFYTQTAGVLIREAPAVGEVRCLVPRCPLPPGQYTITLWADQGGDPLDWIQRACELTVARGRLLRQRPGAAAEPPVRARRPPVVGARSRRVACGRGEPRRGRHDMTDLAARVWRAFDAIVLWRLRRWRDRLVEQAPAVGERLYRGADAAANLPFRSERIDLPGPLAVGDVRLDVVADLAAYTELPQGGQSSRSYAPAREPRSAPNGTRHRLTCGATAGST